MIEGLDGIDLSSFSGRVKILHGVEVEVEFDDGVALSEKAWKEPPTLVVRGITRELAIALLRRNRDVVSIRQEVPTIDPDRAARDAQDTVHRLAPKDEAALAAALAAAVAASPGSQEDIRPADVADRTVISDAQVADLDKLEKLRDVVDYLVKLGLTTSEQIVAAAVAVKDRVKTLKALAAKGGSFEKKMERAVAIVLSPTEPPF